MKICCGRNAYCKMSSGIPLCFCNYGFIGSNPYCNSSYLGDCYKDPLSALMFSGLVIPIGTNTSKEEIELCLDIVLNTLENYVSGSVLVNELMYALHILLTL